MEDFFELDNPSSEFRDELLKEYMGRRYLVLNTTIDDNVLEDISLRIMKYNYEDKDLPADKRKPIWLLIQSSGGGVLAGLNLIDIIKASTTPVYTVCFSLCASMAFHLFISGHRRYAFKHSALLLHDGEIAIVNSNSKAKDTMDFFNSLDDRMKQHVLDNTKITSEHYDSVYQKEYYIYANSQGKDLGCVDYIIGEDVSLDEILKN